MEQRWSSYEVAGEMNRKSRTRETLAMLTRFALVALAGLALATPTLAATSAPRFKLKQRWTLRGALTNVERKTNRIAGFSAADCWLSDGNARLGWRHGHCVGNVTYQGRVYRYKTLFTPVSCRRERVVITIPGLTTQRKTVIAPKAGGFRIEC